MDRLRGAGLERLDHPSEDPNELRVSLLDLARLNRWFGGARAVATEVARLRLARGLQNPISVLDVGCGAADIPRALLAWGARQGLLIRAVGCDLHAPILAEAAQLSRNGGGVQLVRADATRLPFQNNSFDIVTCTLLLHHLSEEQVAGVLAEMNRAARHGLVVCDLERSPAARIGVWLAACAVSRSRWTRYDAAVSVRRAYTLEELRELSARAGCNGMLWCPGPLFRLTGVLEK